VGRTSVEAISEDPVVLNEAVVDEDLAVLSEVAFVEVWKRTQRSRRAWRGPSGGL
jgi:hypothetical protein